MTGKRQIPLSLLLVSVALFGVSLGLLRTAYGVHVDLGMAMIGMLLLGVSIGAPIGRFVTGTRDGMLNGGIVGFFAMHILILLIPVVWVALGRRI